MQGLAAGVAFYFRARLVDKSGNQSPWTAFIRGESSSDTNWIIDAAGKEFLSNKAGQRLQEQMDFNSEAIMENAAVEGAIVQRQLKVNGDLKADILHVQTTQVTDREAFAEDMKKVQADVGENAAAVQTKATAVFDIKGDGTALYDVGVGLKYKDQFHKAGMVMGSEVKNGQVTIVRGTGTKWKSNINGIAAGQIISIQSGNTVIQNVIQSVNSDTELVLAFAPSVSLNNAKYVISTTVPDTVSDGVRHMCAINAAIILFLQNMDRWMSENGKVDVEMPNGQKVTLDSIRALQAAVEGKLDKFQNGADIQNKSEFVKNLGLSGVMKIGDYGFGGGGRIIQKDSTQLLSWLRDEYVSEIYRNDSACAYTYRFGSNLKIRAYDTWGNISIDYSGSGVRFAGGNGYQDHLYDVVTGKDSNVVHPDPGVGKRGKSLNNLPNNQIYFVYSDGVDGSSGVAGTMVQFAMDHVNSYPFQIMTAYWDGQLRYRAKNGDNGNWMNWRVAWDNRNAVFDGNGFLKKTSPIIQRHPDGTFTTNDESEGATVTKLGLGHYRISGILGYNADGAWGVHGGISVPRDVNGNELVYVDDKVLPDGAIEIKVTHRQNAHMPARLQNRRIKSQDEQTHYTDDEPCDLPAGTRLDARVQMPEDSIWNQKQALASDPQQEHDITSAVNK
ncbi:phage tail tip fiber protein [Xenorhabdus bovienii]|uniref:phage tail fiber protein n=1 Tax=Xenorhabdus bovienii TaxID=40576 RepID=UPI003DA4CB67